jgi:hypothetical protein
MGSMRARKIEKIDRFLYLIAEWKYVYSKDVFLRLQSRRSERDICFARLLPAANEAQLLLRTMRAGQALEMVLDESSNIMFEAISFATSDKKFIISTLDKDPPYRIINIIESDNRWIVNAIQFFEAKGIPKCEGYFHRELVGEEIALVRCPRSRLDFVDFKKIKKETIRSITDIAELKAYMLTISRRNRAYVVEDIETITSNDKHELISMLKKRLAQRKEDTQLAKT